MRIDDAPVNSKAPLGGGFWLSCFSNAAISFSQRCGPLTAGADAGRVVCDHVSGQEIVQMKMRPVRI